MRVDAEGVGSDVAAYDGADLMNTSQRELDSRNLESLAQPCGCCLVLNMNQVGYHGSLRSLGVGLEAVDHLLLGLLDTTRPAERLDLAVHEREDRFDVQQAPEHGAGTSDAPALLQVLHGADREHHEVGVANRAEGRDYGLEAVASIRHGGSGASLLSVAKTGRATVEDRHRRARALGSDGSRLVGAGHLRGDADNQQLVGACRNHFGVNVGEVLRAGLTGGG